MRTKTKPASRLTNEALAQKIHDLLNKIEPKAIRSRIGQLSLILSVTKCSPDLTSQDKTALIDTADLLREFFTEIDLILQVSQAADISVNQQN